MATAVYMCMYIYICVCVCLLESAFSSHVSLLPSSSVASHLFGGLGEEDVIPPPGCVYV